MSGAGCSEIAVEKRVVSVPGWRQTRATVSCDGRGFDDRLLRADKSLCTSGSTVAAPVGWRADRMSFTSGSGRILGIAAASRK